MLLHITNNFKYINDKDMVCWRRHYSKTRSITQYEKRNPKTKKIGKVVKGSCSNCGRKKIQIFTE